MKTIRELVAFMESAAAKHKEGRVLGTREAAQAVAAEHGADADDVAFVGSVLVWSEALVWAEARLKRPGLKTFTCPKCGSSHFGSSGLTRHCHGGDGCKFTFHQRDDHLYFKEEDDG